jgi:hypothetical protein
MTIMSKPFNNNKRDKVEDSSSPNKVNLPQISFEQPQMGELKKYTYVSMKLHNNIRDNNSPCYDTHVKFFKEGSCEDFLLLENNLARVFASQAVTTGPLKHATTACPCIEEAALATRGYRHKRKCSEYILKWR